MLSKAIVFFNRSTTMLCDGKCNKAWGMNCRPQVYFDNNGEPLLDMNSPDFDYDNHAYLPDNLLGEAPRNPGTYEGGYGKPDMAAVNADPSLMNKWCARECERNYFEDEKPKDFTTFRFNMPSTCRKDECGAGGQV